MGTTKFVRVALTVAACVAVGACKSKDDNAGDSAAAGTNAATGDTGAARNTATPAPAMSDANILAVLDRANANDSSGGAMASTKATSADVKAFGRMMMTDHHKLRQQGQDLAKKENVTPQPPATDSLQMSHDSAAAALQAMPKGHEWDHAYIDHEVKMHEAVLATAQAAAGMAHSDSLRALIQGAAPAIQAHLDRAKQIQQQLNASSAPGSSKSADTGRAKTKSP